MVDSTVVCRIPGVRIVEPAADAGRRPWWCQGRGRGQRPAKARRAIRRCRTVESTIQPPQWADADRPGTVQRIDRGSAPRPQPPLASHPRSRRSPHRPAAWTRPARAARRRHDDVPDGGRRRRRALPVRPLAQRGLDRLAGRSARRSRHEPRLGRLSDAQPDHVRELPARAARRARAEPARDRGVGGRGPRDPAAGAAADLSGRIRLHRLRAAGRAARPRPIHARGRTGVERRSLRIPRLALPALPLRPAVHAAQLCLRAARAKRRAMGVQGACGALQPRGGRVGRARRRTPWAVAPLGGGLRRAEPGAARARRRRRPQRHADHARARGRAGAHGRRRAALPRGRRDARGGGRREGDRRPGAAVHAARRAARGRPERNARGRRARARRARRDRPDRLR
jgi:hypothetical protein